MTNWKVVLIAVVLAGGCGGDDRVPGGSPTPDAGPEGGGATCAPAPKDSDGDTISDDDESASAGRDTDRDGTPDFQDTDSDGDGLADAVEAGDANPCSDPRDTDAYGVPDFRSLDADGNGIADADEPSQDLDGDGLLDFQDRDDDGDTLYDDEEGGASTDFDGDGTPDYQDTDSDDDGVRDRLEGFGDGDGDGVPAYHDGDSDGDCRSDEVEAGATPGVPLNSDSDATPDFLDLDADNDGLPDEDEDLDCDGQLDAGESSPLVEDTDGDGYPDIVEWAAKTDPNDRTSQLDPNDFFFVLPYFAAEQQDDLDFETSIVKADVQISMDTTGSMGGSVAELQNTLSSVIIPETAREVVDVAFGASTFEDFPIAPFGSLNTHSDGTDDAPFRLYQRITTNVAAAQSGVNAFDLGIGGDGDESGLEGLYQIATGEGVSWPGGSVAKFQPFTGFDSRAGHGVLGGVGFRRGALPVIVHVTDIEWHEAADYIAAGIPDAHDYAQTKAALQGLGARVIGITSSDSARSQLEGLARDTGTVVPPTAWGAAETLCHTGPRGSLLPPDPTGLCPLVFGMDVSGAGVSSALVDGIKALVTFGTIDISAIPVADSSQLPAVDTARFITAIAPVPPAPSGATIIGDAFVDVRPGAPVRFRVHARNTIAPHKREAQLFAVSIRVLGDRVTTLDEREVFIIVPGGSTDP